MDPDKTPSIAAISARLLAVESLSQSNKYLLYSQVSVMGILCSAGLLSNATRPSIRYALGGAAAGFIAVNFWAMYNFIRQ